MPFTAFTKSKRPVGIEQVRFDFATLCSECAFTPLRLSRYREAFVEFSELEREPSVHSIGVRLDKKELYVGTWPIVWMGSDDKLRLIGEFIVHIKALNPPIYECENVSFYTGEKKARHPHVGKEGKLCLRSGSEELNMLLRDGRLGLAALFIVRCLNTIEDDKAFYDARVDTWPTVEAVEEIYAR